MRWERGRDQVWAWTALVVAVVLALVVAPWDARSSGVSLAGAAEGAQVAGGESLDGMVAMDGAAPPLDGSVPGTGSGTTTGSGTGSGGAVVPGGDTAAAGGHRAGGSAGTRGGGPGSPRGAGQSPVGTATVSGGQTSRGVTDREVRVGFIVLRNTEEAGNEYGMGEALPAAGNPAKQIEDLAAWINSRGGIGGRKLVPIIRGVDFRTSRTTDEQQICSAFVQDDEVFAVVLIAQIRESTRMCYAEGKTLMFDAGGYPMSGQLYAAVSPYLWSPNAPTLSTTSRALPGLLKSQKYYEPTGLPNDPCKVAPCRVGVLMYDFPSYEKLLSDDLLPAFSAAGVKVEPQDVQRVDASDAGTIQAGLTNATVRFQSRSVSRVVFLGGAPLAPFFMVVAEQQRYRPVYGMTSFDSPRFGTDNTNLVGPQMQGARGLGFMPANDVREPQYPSKTPMEQQCRAMYDKAGHKWEERYDARIAVAYCESMLLLKHVADQVAPSLTPEIWAGAAEGLGDSFQTAEPFKTHFAPGRHAGAAAYRPFAFDMDCACNVYTGRPRRL